MLICFCPNHGLVLEDHKGIKLIKGCKSMRSAQTVREVSIANVKLLELKRIKKLLLTKS